MKQNYFKSLTMALVLATPLVTACGKTVGETIDDTTITTRVKTPCLKHRGAGGQRPPPHSRPGQDAMRNHPAVGGLWVDVDTFKGAVTLSGQVKSDTER